MGRSGLLKGAARDQITAFIKWCLSNMGAKSQPDFDLPDFDYRIYLGHFYAERIGGKTHMKPMRNIVRRNRHNSPYVIAIHFDRRALCDPFDMAHIIVHELRHALDYQWEMRFMDRARGEYEPKVQMRNGLLRGEFDQNVVTRKAEQRAEAATRAFFRDVREFQIIQAYESMITPEVRMQLCDQRTRFMSMMQRMGR